MAVFVCDVAWQEHEGETRDGVLAELEAAYGVEAKVLVECGPGGGWPEVEFTGRRAALETMALNVFSYDEPELADLIAD